MFHETQIQSYQNITAPADLRMKVMDACRNTQKASNISIKRVAYSLAPIAACALLFISVLSMNRETSQPLILMSGDIVLNSYNSVLPAQPPEAGTMVRTISLLPPQYTVTMNANIPVEIISADGQASSDESGNITWTVDIPNDDMAFELLLRVGDETYFVPLTYDAQNGSFSIRCKAK